MEAPHTAVLPRAVLHALDPKPGDTVIDGTLGAGGHAELLLERTAPDGAYVGIDLDAAMIAVAKKRLARFADRTTFIHGAFDDILRNEHVSLASLPQPRHVFLDLGVSSFALDDVNRGLSFLRNGPLDMRFNPEDTKTPTAAFLLLTLSSSQLATIFRVYGEEKFASPIADAIVNERSVKPIETTGELAQLVTDVYAEKFKTGGRTPYLRGGKHPATRIFQSLRIAVNDEIGRLERALPEALKLLTPGSRMTVISFHSLEDRIVKNFFREHSRSEQPTVKLITKKPLVPDEEEIAENPRSRSAKLRAAERI
ncbi:MAG: 16S rRNA (cytosine(1402)-N(4))-methyltransferase RsmH [Patescibacteria group bacterium]|jgi:16S rRNA (cytosine1402-N4)-methyltransferase